MQANTRAVVVAAGSGLIVGLLLGFIPEQISNSHLAAQAASLTDSKGDLQTRLGQTQDRLTISNFAVRAGAVAGEADANNYSVAGGDASGLFTDLRHYVDSHGQSPVTQQLTDVLSVRDRTITGLAQADPAVKALVQQIFTKLQGASALADRSS